MICHRFAFLLLALLFAQAATAAAQSAGAAPSVSGTGVAAIERAPQTLRMEVDVLAKGKDLKDALSKLKQRRKAAEQQLAKLGADTKSIRFGTPKVSSIDNDQQRQMQMMMRQRMLGRGKRRAADKPAVAPPVTIAVSLVAEWPLKSEGEDGAEGSEQLLLAAHNLEAKVKEADLGGRKAAEELSPEEAELAEENEDDDEQVYYGGQPQAKPGEPRFVYVASISDQERAEALAKAFERAKADAQRLAQAAGVELGALQRLSGGNESAVDSDSDEWGPYEYQMYQRAARQQPSDDKLEAVGPRPGMLKYQVMVSATFALK